MGEKSLDVSEIGNDINNLLLEKHPQMKNFPPVFNLMYVCGLVFSDAISKLSKILIKSVRN